jgi:ubiquinone/menaquinone biosynthesis C-methylase UbiE
MKKRGPNLPKSSWESSGEWYDKIVGSEGHYYHQHVILPGALKLLQLSATSKLLDLGCGQGILSRHIPEKAAYAGVDAAPSLIQAAKRLQPPKHHQFYVGDVTKKLPLTTTDFTHAACILMIQNVVDPGAVFKQAAHHLKPGGTFFLVMNHPCFRIPRQSSWQIDAPKKIQYRRIDRYMSPLEIPIQTHPGQATGPQTLSYHHNLSDYTKWLKEAGFAIALMDEWCSNKKSTGSAAKMEDRARKEFPLFLAILAKKRT